MKIVNQYILLNEVESILSVEREGVNGWPASKEILLAQIQLVHKG
jgi:hypothetical protein